LGRSALRRERGTALVESRQIGLADPVTSAAGRASGDIGGRQLTAANPPQNLSREDAAAAMCAMALKSTRE
jgi:hypothetical protein